MSKEVPKRLQGPEWYTKKDSLIMTQCRINEKGHIKGTYMDTDGNLYSHWLSNKEAEEFKEQEKIQEEIHFNNIGNYKVGVRANDSLSMYHIPDEEEDAVTAYKEAIHHMGVDFGKGPDHTNISLNIPRMDISDIEMNIDRVLSSSELMNQMNELVIKDEKERYVRVLMNRLHKVKEVRDYIDDKIQKSMEYDWGRSGNRSDQMFTETVIELQLVIQKLDEILEGKGEKDE